MQTMQGPIWEQQERGRAPVSPQDLIGLGLLGRALRPLFMLCLLLLARDPHGENRRKSEQIVSDLQLQHSSGLCFSPHCPCGSFWTRSLPK